jgi:hypothetical protein
MSASATTAAATSSVNVSISPATGLAVPARPAIAVLATSAVLVSAWLRPLQLSHLNLTCERRCLHRHQRVPDKQWWLRPFDRLQ